MLRFVTINSILFNLCPKVLAADWSVVTKDGGVFDLMNMEELRLSVTAAVGHLLSCRARLQTNFSLLAYIPLLSQGFLRVWIFKIATDI